MLISGELFKNRIFVKKPRDIGRLYNKSCFGRLVDEKLQLDLVEGVFLFDQGKLKVFQDKKEITFQELIQLAVQHVSEFEIKYLVFKDLRNRGLLVKPVEDETKKRVSFYQFKQKKDKCKGYDTVNGVVVSVFSERGFFDIEQTEKLIKEENERGNDLWFAIVDEEGDITYYTVSIVDIKGGIGSHVFPKCIGFLLRDRVVVFDEKASKMLFEKEFFGKPFGSGLQLSMVEALYLSHNGVLVVRTLNGEKVSNKKLKELIEKVQPDIKSRVIVYKDLKQRGLIVKTGFKFGTHFRVYTKKPGLTHAEYLVHVVDRKYKGVWAEISRAVRLAHSVNKEIVFARVNSDKKVEYIRLGRLRP